MTFRQITLDGKTPTVRGVDAMELVYEKLTGECYHDSYKYSDGAIYTIRVTPHYICGKCNEKIGSYIPPALLTSLDDWRPLLDSLDETIADNYHDTLRGLIPYYFWLAQPHHHLEGALHALEDTCPRCKGTAQTPDFEAMRDEVDTVLTTEHGCALCEDEGVVSLYTIWGGNAMTDNEVISKWLDECDGCDIAFERGYDGACIECTATGGLNYSKLSAWTPELYKAIEDAGLVGDYVENLEFEIIRAEDGHKRTRWKMLKSTPAQRAMALAQTIREVG